MNTIKIIFEGGDSVKNEIHLNEEGNTYIGTIANQLMHIINKNSDFSILVQMGVITQALSEYGIGFEVK